MSAEEAETPTPDSEATASAAETEFEAPELAPRRGHESRFDDLPAGLAGNVKAKAVAAITDRAAPEAFTHSAVTRLDVADAAGAERTQTIRLETAAHAAATNAHLNLVRDQIVAAVTHRQGDRLEIRLDPPELGKVMIGFERDGADIVRAVVTADSPNTLDLMRRNADVFQRALEAQGFANLDLHFTDRGPREHANARAGEHAQSFVLNDDIEFPAAGAPGRYVADGRLDRRF
ncbi:MAG: flagellar hook-length control protein FliK [Parvularculaceae bacterium]